MSYSLLYKTAYQLNKLNWPPKLNVYKNFKCATGKYVTTHIHVPKCVLFIISRYNCLDTVALVDSIY